MKKHFNLIIVLILTMLCMSCDRDAIYENIVDFEDEKWPQGETVVCEFEIEDAEEYYTLYLNVRNSIDYKYQNLYLFVDLKTPDGNTYRDTVQLYLADRDGNWYGKGKRLKDRKYYFACPQTPLKFSLMNVPYKTEVQGKEVVVNEYYPVKVKFPQNGKYRFTFRQAMREGVLEGIANFGLTVKKFNEKALVKEINKENKRRTKISQSK